jgi:hypothetical protein
MREEDPPFGLTDPVARNLALRNDSAFLCSKVTNREAAALLHVSPSHLSEWKRDNLPRLFAVLAAHGMKVVDKADPRVPARVLDAYKTLAREHMAEAADTMPGELDE